MGVQTEITVEECTQLVSSLTPSIIGRELLLRLALTHSRILRTYVLDAPGPRNHGPRPAEAAMVGAREETVHDVSELVHQGLHLLLLYY